ncbi:MAG: fimbrial protein [Pseudomonadota bacterium]
MKKFLRPGGASGQALCGVLVLVCASSTLAQMPGKTPRTLNLHAFSSDTYLPSLAPVGTVVARQYVTPQQMCEGAPSCRFWQMKVYPYGGSADESGKALIPTNVSGISAQVIVNGQPAGSKTSGGINTPLMEISSPVEVQLIRDSRPLASGSLRGTATYPDYWIFWPMGMVSNAAAPGIRMTGNVHIIPGTCRVPGQTVALPPVSLTSLHGIGATSGARAFSILLENCPAGFNRVGYTLTPIGGEMPGIPGTLKPSAGSTATGVAVRLTDASGAPATFGTSLPVTSYNKLTGGAAGIAMNASYVRTGAMVLPGTVKGAMQVLLDYQ